MREKDNKALFKLGTEVVPGSKVAEYLIIEQQIYN